MSSVIQGNPWIWVLIRGEVDEEQYVGQYDEENDISFIPGFLTKDDALKGYHLVKREKGLKYEVQAVRYKELLKDARDNGFMIFIVDEDGNIQEKI